MNPATVRQWVRRARDRYEVFTVEHDNETLLPALLLDADLLPRPEFKAVVEVLTEAGEDSWGLWAWLVHPTPWLDGAIPAVLLFENPTSCSTSPAGGHRTLRDCSRLPRTGTCPVPSPSTVHLRPATYGRARSWPWLPHLVAGTVLAGVVQHLRSWRQPVLALHDKREGNPDRLWACSQTVALLETVFHDVHASVGSRLITHMDLVGRNLVDFGLSERLVLYDLTDDALGRLDLQRDQLVSTTAAHYPCTREWAEALHARKGPGGSRPVGLLWNSG